MSGRLDGQTAWISGGASGIGEAVVRLFAAEGARVAIVDIQTEKGRQLEQELRSAGANIEFVECNVAQEAEIQKSIEQTVSKFGGLQIMVHCAGVVHVNTLNDYAQDDWDLLMAINLRSIYQGFKHGFEHLCKNPISYLVTIGSISSFVGQSSTPAYTASKHAVLGLSRSIALDHAAQGIRCNCICPGITDTPMLRYHLKIDGTDSPGVKALENRLSRVPVGRAITPLEIAKAALYFSCEDSAGITGTSLVVDGGYLAAAEWNRSEISLPDDLQ